MFLIINSAEKGVTEFCEPLEKILKDANIDSKTIEYRETRETEISKHEGVIISGSPRGDDIADSHQPYFRWIKTAGKPVFGICAGHHIVGRLYGAELLRSLEKEVGNFIVEIDTRDPVFRGFPDRFMVRQNHHDSITLPTGFILLAHSDACRVEAVKHRTLPIYTTQFHPEFLNPGMILNFVDIARQQG